MIKITIEDENGEKHYIEARGMTGGALIEDPTPTLKPVKPLKFGSPTLSDQLSMISAQLSQVTAQLIIDGIPMNKISETFMMLTTNAIAETLQQPRLMEIYRKGRGK